MRRTFIASWLAVVLVGGVAVADDQPQTLKSDDHCFTDLSARAGDGGLELGGRSGAAPDYVETQEIGPQRLPARVVQGVVAERMGEIEYCWDKSMQRVKAPAGEIAVSFVIGPRGTVGSVQVTVSGSKGKPGLEKCVAQRVKKWRFPQADVETEVTIPFAFGTAGSAI
jgi:TonB family protein